MTIMLTFTIGVFCGVILSIVTILALIKGMDF